MNFEILSADLESQPITGFLHTGERINIPLISHIEDNLYVGGCIDGVDLGDYFDYIFSMYVWEQYSYGENTTYVPTTMYDSPTQDIVAVDGIANQVVNALETGGNVLVHCQAGINRSNLIAAAALVKRGRSAQEAIDLLSERRSPHILANKTFRTYILSLDHRKDETNE